MEKNWKIAFNDTYLVATQIARKNKQVVGEKNDYYITLAQLEHILLNVVNKLAAPKE